MLYVINARDVADSLEARKAARPAHLVRLRELQALGRLVLAGPCPLIDAADLSGGVAGSVIVAEFETLQDARAWAETDPYVAGGVYAHVTVEPFIRTFPE